MRVTKISRLFVLFISNFILVLAGIAQQMSEKVGSNKNVGKQAAIQDKLMSDTFIHNLLGKYPRFFDSIVLQREKLGIQIIYTRIDRSKRGKPQFADFFYGNDNNRYFYPASTVKLPVAILALQKLNELRISGLDQNTTMITEAGGGRQTSVINDPSAPDGRPTIAHYIKKILLVSDNDAFNRLYEFLGQEYINNTLHGMGYMNAQIIHRLEISLPEEENRYTNPVKFLDSAGGVVYEKAAEKSRLVYAPRDTKMGKGFYRGGQLINEPFDFSIKNRLTLEELHSIVRSIIFPGAVPEKMRFNLTEDDYIFLRKYMSMMPYESVSPLYDTTNYWDTYVKFLYYGSEKGKAEKGIRIFNKPGDAYGFMIDAAYIADFDNNIEFFLSAVIHCNNDEIFNDDKYEYSAIGLPFMKNLGRVIYEYERTRVRKYQPVLSSMFFDYSH
ncbi:MAG: serine hydrolase [Chitinophagaceae bacterium]|nr:serine hydrolase [Chitinophagaceae bacterium]